MTKEEYAEELDNKLRQAYDIMGHICVKCGACGRKFDDKGVMI